MVWLPRGALFGASPCCGSGDAAPLITGNSSFTSRPTFSAPSLGRDPETPAPRRETMLSVGGGCLHPEVRGRRPDFASRAGAAPSCRGPANPARARLGVSIPCNYALRPLPLSEPPSVRGCGGAPAPRSGGSAGARTRSRRGAPQRATHPRPSGGGGGT